MTTIETNLRTVRARIATACHTHGRAPSQVSLLAVSKTFPASDIRQAHACGQTAFGENYITEGVEKIAQLQDLFLQWHCIGPIQSNKTRLVAEHFDWVHTIDRLKIAERLNEQRPTTLLPMQVCIQVNLDGGANKSGVAPNEVFALAQALQNLPRLTLRGLMCIPEPAADFEAQCAIFKSAKALFEQLNQTGLALDTLSMGMTGDLEAAVASGSTLVRVGTAIFGGRAKLG
jgi:PLP dependent protein